MNIVLWKAPEKASKKKKKIEFSFYSLHEREVIKVLCFLSSLCINFIIVSLTEAISLSLEWIVMLNDREHGLLLPSIGYGQMF